MASLEEIQDLSNGARFYRADLHIHSYGASHDVKDKGATPQAIVNTAIQEGLDIIAITDHNDIRNVRAAVDAASNTNLFIVPGVELSTSSGHLLAYLPTIEKLEQFIGRIDLADQGKPNSRCQTSILECLKLLDSLSGFGVLAHVDAPSGFEIENPGHSPHKLDVLGHRALLGIELLNALSDISYSDQDTDQNRKLAGRDRIKRLGLGASQFLARVLNSDAHTINALGRNSRGDNKVTRFKMERPSFAALQVALQDADARVRIEELIPQSVPRVLGVAFEGGFLSDQAIHFSPNLNCIIGGRGTGKSTIFEAVRVLTDEPKETSVLESEVGPAEISLFWRDEAGQEFSLSRAIGGEVVNDSDSSAPTKFSIESYGQGETAQISKEGHQNPIALLGYLDRFVAVSDLLSQEDRTRDSLLEFQSEIEKANQNVALIPQHERALSAVQQQLRALERANAAEVIKLQRSLAEERAIRSNINEKLSEIRENLTLSTGQTVEELAELAEAPLSVGAAEFAKIVAAARVFATDISKVQTGAEASFEKLRTFTEAQLISWKAKDAEAAKAIENKRKALEAQGIKLDMAYIQKLAKDEATQKTAISNLKTWKPHLVDIRKKYEQARKKRWEIRDRVATTRSAFGRKASETLRATLNDFQVTLKFSESAYSPDAERQIIEAMGWRTIQIPRAALLIERLTLRGFLAAIDSMDVDAIAKIKTDEGATVFDKSDAKLIFERLAQPSVRFGLERAPVYDLPKLTITKSTVGSDGKSRFITRDFSKLSLGQQQSVLLTLMLSSESRLPLIIDQPEDNLDGEFIFHSLVPVLRRVKERRQVIIVTHNPNIAVLGDAEQIIVMKSTSENGIIVSRGSIDDAETKESACNILEGAKEAFQRRANMYGFKIK